jgi:hypothetical protein
MIGVRALRACDWHLEPLLCVAHLATVLRELGKAPK